MAIQQPTLANGSLEDLKQVFRYAMVKVGLRAANWPTDDEKPVLFEHVLRNYGTHTADEVKLAFDLAIAGKLEFEEGQSANCYENFSCLYFSNVMNAYRQWAADAYRQSKADKPKEIPPPEESLSDQTYKEWLEDTRKNKMAVEFMPPMLYQWCIDTGLISLSLEQKKEYWQKAIQWRQHRLSQELEKAMTKENHQAIADFNSMKESGKWSQGEKKALQDLSKKMVLFNYLFDKV